MTPSRARPIAVASLEPLEQRLLLSGQGIPSPPENPVEAALPMGQTQALVSGVDQGYVNAGGFAWHYRYHISLLPPTQVLLETYISLSGAWTPQLRDTWEQGIEEVWSGRYEIHDAGQTLPIVFDVHFNGALTDHYVYVSAGAGPTTMTDWFTDDEGLSAAHEAGHMIGLYDEYRGGAVDPAGPVYDSDAIMGALVDDVRERYYQGVLSWLEDNTGRDMSLAAIPAPADVVALAALPATATAVDEITLTAMVSEKTGFPATRVEFYLDSNGNQALDPETDELLGVDTNGQDGWVFRLPSTDLPVGTPWVWARAGTAEELWGQAAAAPVAVNRDAPDLIVAVGQDVIFPPFGRPGWTAVVPVLVSNRTSLRAAGEVGIRILADPTTDAEGDEVLLGQFTRVLDLADGQDATLELHVTLPGDITPGDYSLRVELDTSGAFPEADLANNVAYSAEAFGFNLPEPIELPDPALAHVQQGQPHVVAWTGGGAATTVSLLVLGPGGWQPIGQATPSRDGEASWDTAGWSPGWYGLLGAIASSEGLQDGEFGWLGEVKIVAGTAPPASAPPPAPAGPAGGPAQSLAAKTGLPGPSPPADPDPAGWEEIRGRNPMPPLAAPGRTVLALPRGPLSFRPVRLPGAQSDLDLLAGASPESLLGLARPAGGQTP